METGFFNQKKTPFSSMEAYNGKDNSVRYPPRSNPPPDSQELKKFMIDLIKEMHQ